MKTALLVSVLALFGSQASAANEALIINTPAKDSIVSATYRTPIVYQTAPETNENDLLVYVDGNRVNALRQAKHEIELEPLSAGKHRICLAMNSSTETQPGVERCVNVIAR